jgi:HK97 family phage major capsid protein
MRGLGAVMPTASLADQRRQVLSTAQAIVAKAQAADRDLTSAEADQVEAAIAEVTSLDSKLKSAALAKSVFAVAPPDPEETPGDLFDEHTKAGFLTAIKSGTSYRASVPRDGFNTKAAVLGGTLLPTAGQGIAPALYPNGVVSLADLMQTVPVDGPTVRYYRVGAGTAAVVAEGAPKPDSGILPTAVDVTLSKIAALLKVSDELSQDAPWLLGALQASLVGAVVSKENEEIIATIGGTSGILTKTSASGDAIDVFADAIAGMQALGTNPSVILVNPTTLSVIRKAKASTSGVYLAVDPLAAGPTTLHGIPTYAVNVVGPTTAYVIDGTGVAYFRRNTVTFELGHDSDDFSKNLQTGRAETRGKAGVMQPLAVTKVTLTP